MEGPRRGGCLAATTSSSVRRARSLFRDYHLIVIVTAVTLRGMTRVLSCVYCAHMRPIVDRHPPISILEKPTIPAVLISYRSFFAVCPTTFSAPSVTPRPSIPLPHLCSVLFARRAAGDRGTITYSDNLPSHSIRHAVPIFLRPSCSQTPGRYF